MKDLDKAVKEIGYGLGKAYGGVKKVLAHPESTREEQQGARKVERLLAEAAGVLDTDIRDRAWRAKSRVI